jgi:hypothetical protein
MKGALRLGTTPIASDTPPYEGDHVMPSGQEFVTHEFDEAIAIQQAIVAGSERLSREHPWAEARRLIQSSLRQNRSQLTELQKYGKKFGAAGKREEVADALARLMEETAAKASSEDSEAYEAQAVLINLKRKQQDSADAVHKMARDMGDTELRDSALTMKRAIKRSADELAKNLSQFAVRIASAE